MKHLTLLSSAAALCTLAACAVAPPSPTVPASLQPPAGERKAFEHFARRVQVCRCAQAAGTAAPAWTFVAPRAVGGAAPSTGCATADIGKEVEVPYTASYVYFVRG